MKLEHEKSHLTIIEEQIRNVKKELEDKQNRIKQLKGKETELEEKKTKI